VDAPVRVIERFTEAKVPGAPGEDLIVVTDDYLAVMDGCTVRYPRSSETYGGVTSGRFAVLALAAGIARLASDLDAAEAIAELSQGLRRSLVDHDLLLDPREADRPSASAVIFSRARRQVWRVGDCQFAVDGRSNIRVKAIDRLNNSTRAACIRAQLLGGVDADWLRRHDVGYEVIDPVVQLQRRFRNLAAPCRFGYGGFDGDPVPARYQEIFPVAGSQTELIMTTDGYPTVEPSLERAEARLFQIMHDDPLLIGRYGSTKPWVPGNNSFDDRAYLRAVV
jgi:hypothetical protein